MQAWGDDALAREFEDALHDHADRQRYSFVGPVAVRFEEDVSLATGRYAVQSRSTRGPAAPAGNSNAQSRYPLLDIDGKRYHLTGTTTTVGRGTEADLTVEDTGVSRLHVRFERTEYGTILTDLGSTNGTFVEDQRIREVTLVDGNAITIGRTTILYWDGLPAARGRLMSQLSSHPAAARVPRPPVGNGARRDRRAALGPLRHARERRAARGLRRKPRPDARSQKSAAPTRASVGVRPGSVSTRNPAAAHLAIMSGSLKGTTAAAR